MIRESNSPSGNQPGIATVTMHLHKSEGNMEEIELAQSNQGIVGVIEISAEQIR